MMSRSRLLFFALSAIPFCAIAQNGPVQISQSTVAATAVNRATNGFPYIINQPGSYQLTSNLVVPAGTNGIGIAASNVTLDLNGFTINLLGPNIAVYAVGSPSMITVRNGSIVVPPDDINAVKENSAVNFGLLTGMAVQDLMISNIRGPSIIVGSNSIVRHNISTGGILVFCPAVIVENVTTNTIVAANTGSGDCVIWNNRASNFSAPVSQ